MPNLIDLTGRTFGRLHVLRRAPNNADGRVRWECVCDCGGRLVAKSYGLTSGNTNSCGCRRREQYAAPRTHGMRHTPTYSSWGAMKTRCTNPNVDSFKDYGGRGITVCERWMNSFEAFLDDMGERPSRAHTIERIDNDGNYEPGNCTWATRDVQSSNSRKNIRLEHDGKNLTLSEWSRRLGVDVRTLSSRLSMGWSPAEILTIPSKYGVRRVPAKHRRDGTFMRRDEQ